MVKKRISAAFDSPEVSSFLLDCFKPEDSVLEEIRSRTEAEGLPLIQLGPMDAQILEVLARSVNPKKIVEIGTLAGYSGVCLARALPKDGRLYTLEINEKNAEVARKSFRNAGLSEVTEVIVGPAMESLPVLEAKGPFDIVFADADKPGYPDYLKWGEKNLRKGGLMIADNTLAYGKLAMDLAKDDPSYKSVSALRQFNQAIAASDHFRAAMIPTGEGLTVGVRV